MIIINYETTISGWERNEREFWHGKEMKFNDSMLKGVIPLFRGIFAQNDSYFEITFIPRSSKIGLEESFSQIY